jgi:23S rRNA pseudouridine1911/1915/1917 synthase
MSVFLVPDDLAGERLDSVAARITGLTRSRVAALITEGLVSVAGQTATKASEKVVAGSLLEIDLSEPVRVPKIKAELADGLRIVYEDAELVVIDKPAGVAAHPSLGWEGPDVVSHLAAAGVAVSTSGAAERQGIVQRLDVGTSGLTVVAKSEHAYSVLKAAFRDHRVEKIYHALVQGHPDPSAGTIDAPIAHHPQISAWKFAVVAGGREAITHYETLEALAAVSLLQVQLETGRTHQIRVHMAAVRHPCVGDLLYGADPVLAERLGLDRQWLHAVKLGFEHPSTGDWVEFTSEPSPDLLAALALLREIS